MSAEKPVMSARAELLRRILSDLAIMTVIGVFLAVLGPFGSIEEPLAVRLITWLTFSYIGYAIYSPMSFVVERAHAALDLPMLPLWLAAVMVATVPMTVLIYFVQFMPNWPPIPPLEEALISYSYVFVIGGGITLLFNFIGSRKTSVAAVQGGEEKTREAPSEPVKADPALSSPPSPEKSPNPDPAPNPLLDALPPELGADIIALEMEDHYVRVHTALGSELVLMRLRDAMAHMAAHMPEVEGRQVHRSWWVARLAVEDVRREGRNLRLVLAGGIEAPVSRAQVSELKAAGWI